MLRSLVGSEMCIRDRFLSNGSAGSFCSFFVTVLKFLQVLVFLIAINPQCVCLHINVPILVETRDKLKLKYTLELQALVHCTVLNTTWCILLYVHRSVLLLSSDINCFRGQHVHMQISNGHITSYLGSFSQWSQKSIIAPGLTRNFSH